MEVKESINKINKGQDLSKKEISSVMNQILTGSVAQDQIVSFLGSLSAKGESIEEVIGSAEVMRDLSSKVSVNQEHLVDTCGTGGVGSGIFNVSTTAAFIASSCGAKVAKHGNRSTTRQSGSADLLETAGVALELNPDQVKQCIENVGVGFMFAPAHHSAMKYAVGARKELGIKTIFNLLGPLTNPAGALNQVLGVFDNKWVRPIAEVLKRLGSKNVLVLHSQDGLDEISTASSTSVAELRDGKIKEYSISPSDFGFKTLAIEGLRVSSPEESLQIAKEALKGENQAAAQMVAMTSGAALYVAGLADTLKVGVDISMEGIKKGIGLQKLDELVSFSQSLKHRG
ncbi:MAG: anthranilate phosphoribosyltransferase [Pseudomonadota bacterium]|nr:anthranilate phosphoribosyltransferase [Pseudomonadota bacterium]